MKATFGTFVLDTGQRQLSRAERVIALSPKAIDLLVLLIARRPDAVSKDELMEVVWKGSNVGEASLTNAIGELRRALGDSPDDSQFIRTAHRFGYAFCATAAISGADGDLAFWCVIGDRQVVLRSGANRIGRDPDAHISLPFEQVSWQHAIVSVHGNDVTITDLNSTNGTVVGSRRIDQPTPLHIGDEVFVADIRIVLDGRSSRRRAPTKRIGG